MDEQRFCKNCGALLERKRKNRVLESLRDFRKREYCGKKCAGSFQQANSGGLKKQVADAVKEVSGQTKPEGRKTAMEFLEDIINDPTADKITRVNAAKALLPFQEKKVASSGKKDQQADAAKEASKGRFGAMSGPKVVGIKR